VEIKEEREEVISGCMVGGLGVISASNQIDTMTVRAA
jgi:hypothetical protein